MIGVMIIPTGIGCEIGGHAGDATPAAKLIASVCDKLILHPNVVNASDINEMPENSLYVEGSILDRFLEGKIELKQVKQNKILVAANPPVRNETINAVSAARATIGLDAFIVELKKPLRLITAMTERGASGEVFGWEELIEQISQYDFDALAISSPITCGKDTAINYFRNGGINPWGAVEAKASKLIATSINKPVAHAPAPFDFNDKEEATEGREIYETVVDPRMAAEAISNCFLHCVLKGLHKAPRIGNGLSVDDVDCLITPMNCVGPPHKACLKAGIPIIAVKENKCCLNDSMPKEFIFVENYLEATGLLMAMTSGIDRNSVIRPLIKTKTYK